MNQTIKKAAKVVGKTLTFRDATTTDASFILSLRIDPEKNRFLSSVSGELEDQVAWLEYYRNSKDQAYFIIEHQDEAIGTVRLYDAQGDSFCWGSWILKNTRPSNAALESALIVYAYAIDHLNFKSSHFVVRKGNERVWQFHERFGAIRTGETDEDFLYEIYSDAIRQSQNNYSRYLGQELVVTY